MLGLCLLHVLEPSHKFIFTELLIVLNPDTRHFQRLNVDALFVQLLKLLERDALVLQRLQQLHVVELVVLAQVRVQALHLALNEVQELMVFLLVEVVDVVALNVLNLVEELGLVVMVVVQTLDVGLHSGLVLLEKLLKLAEVEADLVLLLNYLLQLLD